MVDPLFSRDDTRRLVIDHSGSALRVAGAAGSGRTSLLLERFRRLATDGHDPAILTYARSHHRALTDALLGRGDARFGRTPVHSFPSLANQILDAAGQLPRAPLGDLQELAVLARVIHAYEGRWKSDLGRIAGSDGLRRDLLGVLRALAQNGVDATIAERMRSRARGSRTIDVIALFVDWMHFLEKHRLVTYYDASWRAARALIAEPRLNPIAGHDVLLIDDFHDVDAGQFELLLALAPPGGDIEVDVFGDPSGARYRFRGTDERFLNGYFPERYRPTDVALSAVAEDSRSPGLDDLPLFSARTEQRGTRSFLAAEDDVAECQAISDWAAGLIDDGACSPGDIAVIVRTPGLYERNLRGALSIRGLTLDAGTRSHFALDDLVGTLLALIGGDAGERQMERAMASPLYASLCGAAQVRGGEDVKRVISLLRQDAFASGTFSMSRFLAAAVHPVIEKACLRGEALGLVEMLGEEWDAYEAAVSSTAAGVDLLEFRRLFAMQQHRTNERRDPDAIGLFSAREVAGRTFAHVWVAGCADGVFPLLEASEDYLPWGELRSLFQPEATHGVEFHALCSRDQRLADEEALFETALTRARQALTVSAPLRFAGETVVLPASVAGSFETSTVYARKPRADLCAASEIATLRGSGVRIDTASLRATELQWLAAAPPAIPFSAPQFAMSASRLSDYDRCPRLLFYRRVLGVDEEGSIYAAIGNVVHKVLEKLGESYRDDDALRTALADEGLVSEVTESACVDVAELGSAQSLARRFAARYVAGVVRDLAQLESSRVSGFHIRGIEKREQFDYAGFAFSGACDRVDDFTGGAVVIDYKTGGKTHKTGKKVVEYALDRRKQQRYRQLPMYCWVERERSGRWPAVFCYYEFSVEEGNFVSGVLVSDDPAHAGKAKFFDARKQKQFGVISAAELTTLMDEIAGICADIFSRRDGFGRTDDVSRCRACSFRRLCARSDA